MQGAVVQEFGRGVLVGVLLMTLVGGISYGAWQLAVPLSTKPVDVAKDKNDKAGKLQCSFCGKSQQEVRQLIAGPSVYICDECVGFCNEILASENPDWTEQQCEAMNKAGDQAAP